MPEDTFIHVSFVDADSEQVLGFSDMALSSLPDNFKIATIMHIADEDWFVVRAQPAEKKKFAETRMLKLYLRKKSSPAPDHSNDPEDALFSLPTICNFVAELEQVSPGENLLTIREDDWRNIEFISAGFAPEVSQMLKQVLLIHEQETAGEGFKKQYVRELIPRPLDKSLPFGDLLTLLSSGTNYSGIAYENQAGRIKGGFGFRTAGGIVFYGRREDSLVTDLSVLTMEKTGSRNAEIEALVKLCQDHELLLVHWPAAYSPRPGGEQFKEFWEDD